MSRAAPGRCGSSGQAALARDAASLYRIVFGVAGSKYVPTVAIPVLRAELLVRSGSLFLHAFLLSLQTSYVYVYTMLNAACKQSEALLLHMPEVIGGSSLERLFSSCQQRLLVVNPISLAFLLESPLPGRPVRPREGRHGPPRW